MDGDLPNSFSAASFKRPEGTGITVENVEGNMEGMKNALPNVRNVISDSR
jgi:hypothetical protein